MEVGVSQDSSTAIWNRDSILELLTRELARTTREGRNLVMMLIRIDQLDDINKQYGPTESDLVTKEVAKRLSSSLLRYDHVGRYSADQLLVLALSCDETNAVPLAHKLREVVASWPIELKGTDLRVTLSVSLAASADFPSRNQEVILGALERGLRQAVARGGDRVETVRASNAASPVPLRPRRRIPILFISVVLLLVGVAVLFTVAPEWTCAPFRLRDVMDPGELPPPIPATCVPTSDKPSDETIQSLETRRQSRGLLLQSTLTCKIPSAPGARADRARDRQWLTNLYADGAYQYRRHIFIATSQDVPGGTLLTIEQCLVPSWTYMNQAGDACWDQYAFWR